MFFLLYFFRSCAGILEQSMEARNQVGIGLSYRPSRLNRLAESIPWNRFLASLIKSLKNRLWSPLWGISRPHTNKKKWNRPLPRIKPLLHWKIFSDEVQWQVIFIIRTSALQQKCHRFIKNLLPLWLVVLHKKKALYWAYTKSNLLVFWTFKKLIFWHYPFPAVFLT